MAAGHQLGSNQPIPQVLELQHGWQMGHELPIPTTAVARPMAVATEHQPGPLAAKHQPMTHSQPATRRQLMEAVMPGAPRHRPTPNLLIPIQTTAGTPTRHRTRIPGPRAPTMRQLPAQVYQRLLPQPSMPQPQAPTRHLHQPRSTLQLRLARLPRQQLSGAAVAGVRLRHRLWMLLPRVARDSTMLRQHQGLTVCLRRQRLTGRTMALDTWTNCSDELLVLRVVR